MASNAPQSPPTTTQRVRNFLAYGFLLSIALHLLIGPLVKFQKTQVEEEKVSVIKRDVIPTPVPTPPPTPKPTPTPPPTPPPKSTPPPEKHTPTPEQPKIKINTAKTTSTKGTGTEASNTHTAGSTNGVPLGTSTATATTPVPVQTAAPTAAPPPPTPTPTKPPSCAVPNAPATTTNAVSPDTPPIAQQQGITGVVNVLVSLDETSHLVGPPKIQSSPSSVLNSAAISAARQSTFRTEIKDCKPVAATYIFAVEFNNQ
ncbi:MAG: hypothetical protein NVS2B17_10500 [Candidatus Velthaea sp.]